MPISREAGASYAFRTGGVCLDRDCAVVVAFSRDWVSAADSVQRWEFTLEPTSVVIGRGALRLEVASSAFPLYDRNPSTDVAPQSADNWNWRRSTQQIAHSPAYPSAIHLPVKGASAW
jgi:predicted acyl esterase